MRFLEAMTFMAWQWRKEYGKKNESRSASFQGNELWKSMSFLDKQEATSRKRKKGRRNGAALYSPKAQGCASGEDGTAAMSALRTSITRALRPRSFLTSMVAVVRSWWLLVISR